MRVGANLLAKPPQSAPTSMWRGANHEAGVGDAYYGVVAAANRAFTMIDVELKMQNKKGGKKTNTRRLSLLGLAHICTYPVPSLDETGVTIEPSAHMCCWGEAPKVSQPADAARRNSPPLSSTGWTLGVDGSFIQADSSV
ncbi:hypothetical protein E2562_016498, partial [Oryza meyeriana var. granulata]